ncbi:hypothetical protein AHAS_Ahas18G0153000 [Arachis hypogaea]
MIEEGTNTEKNLVRMDALKNQVEIWYRRKVEFWKQQSRDRFIKDIDKNTKYFHLRSTIRQRKSRIEEVQVRGRSVKEPSRIKQIARRFFKRIYTQEEVPEVHIKDGLLPKITAEQAKKLEIIPPDEEIRSAV